MLTSVLRALERNLKRKFCLGIDAFFFEETKMEYITESLKISAQRVPKTKLK